MGLSPYKRPNLFFKINLFLAVLDLHCSLQAFSNCSAWVSHCVGFSCCGTQAPGHMVFSSCSSQVQLLAQVGSSWTRDWMHVTILAGRFLTIGPPGKSQRPILNLYVIYSKHMHTCIPVADSFWCLAKLIQLCKI